MYFQKRRKNSLYFYVRCNRCTRTRIDPDFFTDGRDLVCLLFNFDSKIWVCSWVVNHALVMKLTYFRWLEQVFWKFSVQLSLHLDNIVKFVHEVFIEIFPWTWTMNMNTLTQRMCIGTFVPQIWQIEKVHVPSTWSKNYKV